MHAHLVMPSTFDPWYLAWHGDDDNGGSVGSFLVILDQISIVSLTMKVAIVALLLR